MVIAGPSKKEQMLRKALKKLKKERKIMREQLKQIQEELEKNKQSHTLTIVASDMGMHLLPLMLWIASFMSLLI
jgi:hypothetical protein